MAKIHQFSPNKRNANPSTCFSVPLPTGVENVHMVFVSPVSAVSKIYVDAALSYSSVCSSGTSILSSFDLETSKKSNVFAGQGIKDNRRNLILSELPA